MPLADSTLAQVLHEHWGLSGVVLRPSPQGVNNLTRIADTRVGRFVVKIRPADSNLAYEHRTLKLLAQADLPFALPVPADTLGGVGWIETEGQAVALTPWIEGRTPEEGNLEQARVCGRALGELDRALAELPPDSEAPAVAPSETAVPPALERSPALPRQVIHRDFDQSNVLVDGGRVSGVLDFEFCGTDLRVLDLTYALSQWPGGLLNTGREWPVISALSAGYRSAVTLSEDEIEAVPAVLRRRWASTLAFRGERAARGLVSEAELLAEAAELSEAELWLRRNESRLKACVRGE